MNNMHDRCSQETYREEYGKRIMVVDDDKKIGVLLRDILRSYGFIVNICESGAQAYDCVTTGDFDYIITDYDMPGMNGLELTAKFREKNRDTVVIGMSGQDMSMQFLHAGANDFLQKPFDPDRLGLMMDGGDIPA